MNKPESAFSRADLLCCLCAAMLLVALGGSLLASNKSESQRVICFNNLRQIGRAFHIWASDHQDLLPWNFPTRPPDGGTQFPPSLLGNAWFQYSYISNQLGAPKLLVCPADGVKKIANNWSSTPAGGFLHVNYRANAISYPIFLHSLANSPSSWLSGDRNFRVDSPYTSCSVGLTGCFALDRGGIGTWTNALHGFAGHLLFMDGSTHFASPAEFQQLLSSSAQDDGGIPVHGLQAF